MADPDHAVLVGQHVGALAGDHLLAALAFVVEEACPPGLPVVDEYARRRAYVDLSVPRPDAVHRGVVRIHGRVHLAAGHQVQALQAAVQGTVVQEVAVTVKALHLVHFMDQAGVSVGLQDFGDLAARLQQPQTTVFVAEEDVALLVHVQGRDIGVAVAAGLAELFGVQQSLQGGEEVVGLLVGKVLRQGIIGLAGIVVDVAGPLAEAALGFGERGKLGRGRGFRGN